AARSEEIAAFVAELRKGGVSEAELETPEKRGMFAGHYAIHPITGEELPVFVANFVLMGYGTGAVMAVPAHDARDWEFAHAHGLPRKAVVASPAVRDALQEMRRDVAGNADAMASALGKAGSIDTYDTRAAVQVVEDFITGISEQGAHTERGWLFNSGEFDGLD